MTRILLLLCAILGAAPALLLAEADGPDYWRIEGVAADDVLNIRDQANPRAHKIGEIPPGADCVKNLGCKGGLTMEEYTSLSPKERKALERKRPRWCQVEYKGQRGWVAGRYLREGACAQEAAALSGESKPMHIKGFRIDQGSERKGGDIQKDFATDVADCAKWCAREPKCKAFDYHLDLQACWIKDRVPDAGLNPNVVTGVKDA